MCLVFVEILSLILVFINPGTRKLVLEKLEINQETMIKNIITVSTVMYAFF